MNIKAVVWHGKRNQANVRRWTEEIMPLLEDDEDPLGVDDFATPRIPIEDAPSEHP